MKKLNKRQIIILVVAGLFVLYAAYDLLIAGPAAKKIKIQAKPVGVESFVNSISSEMMQQKMVGVDAYIVKSAEMDWGRNPFWERGSSREFIGDEAGKGAGDQIVYSGYVDTGLKKMAIINGWEYAAGESLDIEGYVLKSVNSSRVVIVNRNTGGQLIVPIQE